MMTATCMVASGEGDGGDASSARPRPLSSSSLLAAVASARFKSFQVQHEVLSRNAVLAAVAREIPWPNLLELFQLKFFAVGDALWQQGDAAHEVAFVLCGGFLARRADVDGARAEAMVKPGGSLAALAVHCGLPLPYAVAAAKFKSIALSLPTGRYKSILRQLSPACRANVEALVYDAENKLLLTLKVPPVAPPKAASAAPSRSRDPALSSHAKRLQQASGSAAALHRAVSTPALMTGAVAAAAAAVQQDATASWASLQVAKPVEYEVNSSLLILHAASYSKSTDNLHRLAPAAASVNKKARTGARGALHESAAARLAAKKHAQRRLQSIKLPNPAEAFPPASKRLIGDDASDANLLLIAEMALDETTVKRAGLLDVVPKVHVGRLLKPLRKPAMLRVGDASEDVSRARRPHTVAVAERVSQCVLVADRAEPFRDTW